ncbi:hypothetical protein LOK49_LG14G00257 [Camellia lanceoleosa]|uniref:Uncharacterized protein n=1 Tax=Camellia lanceoleosa TaxID=1840588 RepID=A0ACC0FAL3_9ERIC|nr:hypothetical protein LOK49_LG14G00257 [Camellia lanceoleosa]
MILMMSMILEVHYFWPLDSIRIKEFDNVWNEVTRQSRGRLTFDTIPVMFGRFMAFYHVISMGKCTQNLPHCR